MEGKDKMKCCHGSLFGLWFREALFCLNVLTSDGLQGRIAGPCIVGPVPATVCHIRCGEWGLLRVQYVHPTGIC